MVKCNRSHRSLKVSWHYWHPHRLTLLCNKPIYAFFVWNFWFEK